MKLTDLKKQFRDIYFLDVNITESGGEDVIMLTDWGDYAMQVGNDVIPVVLINGKEVKCNPVRGALDLGVFLSVLRGVNWYDNKYIKRVEAT